MHDALKHNLIATELQLKRRAIDHVLNCTITFVCFRYLKQPFCLTSYDLKGCYDRILHIAAYLALRRVGVRRTKLIAMFSTI